MSIKKPDPENIATPLAGGAVERNAKNNSKRDGMMQNENRSKENKTDIGEKEDVNREDIDEDNDLTKEIEIIN